jgi:hypothetical protein
MEETPPPPAPTEGANGELIFSASDDTYVRGGGYAENRYGGTDPLIVKYQEGNEGETRYAYFRFRLGDHVSSVTSAKLTVYGKPSGDTIFTAYGTADDWCEDCIHWNNRPAFDSTAGSVNANATTQWWKIDVTAYVQAQAAGDKTVSLGFAENAAKYTTIESKEGTNKPQLVIVGSSVEDNEAPTAPSDLTAAAVSGSQIDLSWTASTDNVGVVGYKIYRDSVEVGTTSMTSYSDSGLSASTAYTYTVKAYDAANNFSVDRNTANATTSESSSAMYVGDITMVLGSGGGYAWATAAILILDGNGNPVPNATVSGQWSGNTSDSDNGVTGSDGKVTVQSDQVSNPGKGTYTFTVNNATHASLSYDSSQNVMSSNSITK